jgi:two-component system sensor histidine kinase KdpD
LGALAVATAVLVSLRSYLGLATVALIYLLVVFVSALLWGRGPSLTSAIAAFIALNYFFTVPFHTFVVASTQDVITLLVFLFVAEMTSRLVAQLRRREADARLRLVQAELLRQKEAEAEALRKTDELKSELLAAVSHDLRTPLSSIRVAATALDQNGIHWGDETRHEMLRMIDTEAARLSRLVGNLLDLSRIEAGVVHPQKEWRSLDEVVARAIDDLGDRLREHRVTVQIPESLPLVPLDFTHIEDVFVNLLENAVRHAPPGTEIRISAQVNGSNVIAQVENDGPPVSVEAADEVFNRFYSGRSAYHGTGLGLAICKGLVEAHGGRIWVERPGERGARFALALPLSDASSEPVRQA